MSKKRKNKKNRIGSTYGGYRVGGYGGYSDYNYGRNGRISSYDSDYEYSSSTEPKGEVISTHKYDGAGYSPGSTVEVTEEEYENGVIKVTRTTKFSDGAVSSYSTTKSPSTYGWMRGGAYTDYYGRKKAGESVSSGWSSRYGDNWWQSGYSSEYIERSGRNAKSMECDKIIASVRRSANVVYNSKEEEKLIKVKWADKNSENNSKDENVYISPDVVVDDNTRRSVWNKDERTDVLIAEVMSQSTMKRTMNPDVETRMLARAPSSGSRLTVASLCGRGKIVSPSKNVTAAFEKLSFGLGDCIVTSPIDIVLSSKPNPSPTQIIPGVLAKNIWYAAEVLAAEQDVLSVFPGFSGYFASHRDYYTDEIAHDFIQQQTMDESIEHAVDALRWQMLHPEKNILMPPLTEQAIEYAMKEIALTRTSEEREVAACRIAEELIRMFNVPPPPPSNEEGDDEEKDSDSNEETDSYGEMPGSGGKSKREIDAETLKKIQEMIAKGQKPSIGLSEERGSKVDNQSDVTEDPEKTSQGNLPGSKGEEFDDDSWIDGTEEFNVPVSAQAIAGYNKMVADLQPQIRALRNRLKIQNEMYELCEHGLKKGRLDEGSLYRLHFVKYGLNDSRLFEEAVVRDRAKIAIGLLIDESESMAHGYKFAYARDVAITIVNALKGLGGVDTCVFGHTSESNTHRGAYHGLAIHNYYTPTYRAEESLSKISAFGCTIDGYAISRVGKHLYEWFPDHEKLLIVICDGYPYSNNGTYSGTKAKRHVRNTVAKLVRFGIKTLNVGIGELSKEEFEFMYGKGNSVILGYSNATSLMTVVGNAITNMVAKSITAMAAA